MKPRGVLLAEGDAKLRALERAWDAARQDENVYKQLVRAVERAGSAFRWWGNKLRRKLDDAQVRGIFKNVAFQEDENIYSFSVVEHTRHWTQEEYEAGSTGEVTSEAGESDPRASLAKVLEALAEREFQATRRNEGVPQWDSDESELTVLAPWRDEPQEMEATTHSITVGYSRSTPLGSGTYNIIDHQDWARFNEAIKRGEMDEGDLPDFDWRTGRVERWR